MLVYLSLSLSLDSTNKSKNNMFINKLVSLGKFKNSVSQEQLGFFIVCCFQL